MGMSVAVIFTCWYQPQSPDLLLLLEPNGLGYLQTVLFILVIAATVRL